MLRQDACHSPPATCHKLPTDRIGRRSAESTICLVWTRCVYTHSANASAHSRCLLWHACSASAHLKAPIIALAGGARSTDSEPWSMRMPCQVCRRDDRIYHAESITQNLSLDAWLPQHTPPPHVQAHTQHNPVPPLVCTTMNRLPYRTAPPPHPDVCRCGVLYVPCRIPDAVSSASISRLRLCRASVARWWLGILRRDDVSDVAFARQLQRCIIFHSVGVVTVSVSAVRTEILMTVLSHMYVQSDKS